MNNSININCKYYKKGECLFANMLCNPKSTRCKLNLRKTITPAPPEKTTKISAPKNKSEYVIPHIKSSMKIVDLSKTIPSIYVYGGSLLSVRKYLEDRGMIVSLMNSFNKHTIFVTYNHKNHKYYLSKEHLITYNSENIRFSINIQYASKQECSNPLENDLKFNQFSILSLYGYKVGKSSGLSSRQRQEIIRFLIENRRSSASEIISLLHSNISLRENSEHDYTKAISDWKEDINYIRSKYRYY